MAPQTGQGGASTVGARVHYVAYNGRCLTAIVTGTTFTPSTLSADLAAFTNMANVNGHKTGGLQFHFDVPHCEDPRAPGSWHWMHRGEG
jgi:hypothetical protein